MLEVKLRPLTSGAWRSGRRLFDPDNGGAAGFANGHRLATADPGELSASHVLVGEQSNTSIILDLVDAGGSPRNR